MAMPVTDDCNPAIAGAARRLRVASVSGSLQGYAQLAFDHGLDKTAHPITNHGFNRVKPIVEKIYSRISDRLRGIMLRGNALHGVQKPPPSCSTGKSWLHFWPPPVDFCSSRLAIGAATERARALAMPAGTRAQVYKRDSSGVAPASPQVAYRALLERSIGRPPKKVGRIFGPRRGLRLPAWPRLGHNFANDLAVSIDERHSPLRFIAAERLRGRVRRRARGGLGRVGFLLSTFHVVHHSMIPLRPPHRGFEPGAMPLEFARVCKAWA